ncbi:ABC transporter permease [Methylobacterium gregans]|uniref:Glutathione transport system permease protein GsiC n=1 Tax=Methylobacterium gregans TaxID=374424 RepID=A0AA37HLX2_9HYPH|nr:ABC transporter permease [Methylobacterium gregans]MDQ0521079.1 peptide/nickel transport system permease protein [Methylobacterium gregans]GJD77870.1 Glutathione transport system permease protein GsiC [Methylobacterium gregans]GLS54246.1 peptide ABC transporter permease [Methylobacterium gregans]
MLGFALRRILVAISVAITVSVASFLLLHLSGDLATAIAGPEATGEQIAAIRQQYGLDQPLLVQFADWAGRALQLDFGNSFYFRERVSDLIASRLPVTLTLGVVALCVALFVAIPLGVLAAVRRDTWIDRTALAVSVLGQAMPSFWFGLTLIMIFSVNLRWLPVSGNATWKHFVLPAVALGYYAMPAVMRLTRNGMLEVLASDYVRTARAKGLPPRKVLVRHALRNAVIPVIALAAVQFGFMLGGSIVIEAVFSLQGLGQLAWESIARNDFPVVQAIVLVLAMIYIALTLAADLLNALLDPRLRS